MNGLLIPASFFIISIFRCQKYMLGKRLLDYLRSDGGVFRSGLVLLLGLLLSSSAAAIVDVNGQYFAEPDAALFSSISLDFSGASGNDQRSEVSIDSHSIWRRDRSTWLLIGSYQAAESEGRDTADNAFFHVRYVRKLASGGLEFYAQGQRDRFQKLDSRRLFGLGYRVDWHSEQGDLDVLVGIGLMQEQERFVESTDRAEQVRANLYLTLSLPLGLAGKTRWSLSAYAQPGLSGGGMRSIAVTKIATKLTDKLSLELSVAYDHDNKPTFGVNSENFRYTSGLTYTFSRAKQ